MTGRSASAPPTPTSEPEGHLDRELGDDDREAVVVVRRELDHPDHERDADGVVHPRLAFEDRARAAADLARAEDRERDRRVGRRDRCTDEPGEDPVEAEDVVGGDRDEPGGRERAERRRERGSAPADRRKRRKPMCRPPSKRMIDERDDREPLDVQDRQRVLQRVGRLGERHRADEDHGGVREREAVREAHPEQRDEHGRRHREDDQPEVRDLRHRKIGIYGATGRSRPPSANSLLTRISSRSHGGCRYYGEPMRKLARPPLRDSRRSSPPRRRAARADRRHAVRRAR